MSSTLGSKLLETVMWHGGQANVVLSFTQWEQRQACCYFSTRQIVQSPYITELLFCENIVFQQERQIHFFPPLGGWKVGGSHYHERIKPSKACFLCDELLRNENGEFSWLSACTLYKHCFIVLCTLFGFLFFLILHLPATLQSGLCVCIDVAVLIW